MVSIFKRICITFSRVVPSVFTKKLGLLILYSGKNASSSVVVGLANILGIIISIIIFQISKLFNTPAEEGDIIYIGDNEFGYLQLVLILIAFLSYFFFYFIFYFYYFYYANKRSEFVNNILPDALSLISSNLSSGVTPFHAMKMSIREDFGPLSEAFRVATTKSLGAKSFRSSLTSISDNIKSTSLKRSMKLFSSAVRVGSNVSALLKDLAKDISERNNLKNELVSATKTNSMFIMFMVIVGAPILMSVAIFFVDIMSGIQDSSGFSSDAGASMGFGGEITITSSFLIGYAYVLFFLTGILVSYFIGVMIEGEGKAGLKKAPLIIGGSYIVFYIARFLVVNLLGGMF